MIAAICIGEVPRSVAYELMLICATRVHLTDLLMCCCC